MTASKPKMLLAPYPLMHLAVLVWANGEGHARRDHSMKILYCQHGNDAAQLFVASELYDTEPIHLVDVNLQSWTFGIRKAYTIVGAHYVFYSKELGVVAIMAATGDSPRKQDQTYIPLRLKPRPQRREPFRDGIKVPGPEYFARLDRRLVARPSLSKS